MGAYSDKMCCSSMRVNQCIKTKVSAKSTSGVQRIHFKCTTNPLKVSTKSTVGRTLQQKANI